MAGYNHGTQNMHKQLKYLGKTLVQMFLFFLTKFFKKDLVYLRRSLALQLESNMIGFTGILQEEMKQEILPVVLIY